MSLNSCSRSCWKRSKQTHPVGILLCWHLRKERKRGCSGNVSSCHYVRTYCYRIPKKRMTDLQFNREKRSFWAQKVAIIQKPQTVKEGVCQWTVGLRLRYVRGNRRYKRISYFLSYIPPCSLPVHLSLRNSVQLWRVLITCLSHLESAAANSNQHNKKVSKESSKIWDWPSLLIQHGQNVMASGIKGNTLHT
jgi:hypothetical protein